MNRSNVYISIAIIIAVVSSGILLFALFNGGESSDKPSDTTLIESDCPDEPPANDEPQDECVTPPGFDDDDTPAPAPPTPPTPTPSPTPTPKPEPEPKPDDEPQQATPSEISRGDSSKKQVIFTFDGGADAQSLDEILSTLSKHNVRSTFFVTGKWASANSDGLKQISSLGHEIFNHTYNHPNLTTVSDKTILSEFQQTEQLIKQLTGKTTKPYFRPPYGARNQHVLDVAWSAGYRSVYWTVDALDWQETATAASVKKRILDNVAPGNIYLMHIGDDITGQVLDDVFTTIKSRGYTIVSLTKGL